MTVGSVSASRPESICDTAMIEVIDRYSVLHAFVVVCGFAYAKKLRI